MTTLTTVAQTEFLLAARSLREFDENLFATKRLKSDQYIV